MNLSENQKIVNALKQILEYYDYLEYDENLSAGTNRLCIKVSHPDANCHLGVIKNICAQLGWEYMCEPDRSTRFYIRLMNHNDYPSISTIPHQEEVLRPEPEPDSAIAYYYRAIVRHHCKQHESAIADLNEALRLNPNFAEARTGLAVECWNLAIAEQEKFHADRKRFYSEYRSKFLEREAKRAEVL